MMAQSQRASLARSERWQRLGPSNKIIYLQHENSQKEYEAASQALNDPSITFVPLLLSLKGRHHDLYFSLRKKAAQVHQGDSLQVEGRAEDVHHAPSEGETNEQRRLRPADPLLRDGQVRFPGPDQEVQPQPREREGVGVARQDDVEFEGVLVLPARGEQHQQRAIEPQQRHVQRDVRLLHHQGQNTTQRLAGQHLRGQIRHGDLVPHGVTGLRTALHRRILNSYTSFLHYLIQDKITRSLLLHQLLEFLVVVRAVHVLVRVHVLFRLFLLVFAESRLQEIAVGEFDEGGNEPTGRIPAHVHHPIVHEVHLVAHDPFVALNQGLVVLNRIPEIPNKTLAFVQPVDDGHDCEQVIGLVARVIQKVVVVGYCDNQEGQAVDEDVEEQVQVHLGIVLSDAVADPRTVVVHAINAPLAPPAVIITGRFNYKANRAVIPNPLLQPTSTFLPHPPQGRLVDHIGGRLIIPPQPKDQNCDKHRMVLEQALLIERHHCAVQRKDEERNNHIDLIFYENDGVGESGSVSVDNSTVLLEGIDHVHGGDGQSLAVLSEGEAIPDHSLQEVVNVVSHAFVSAEGDAPDPSAPRQPPDGAVGDDSARQLLAVVAHLLLGCRLGGNPAVLSSACHNLIINFITTIISLRARNPALGPAALTPL